MSHLSLYLDRETETIVRKAAKKNSLSLSKWISRQLKKSARDEWSDNFKKLAGSIPDMPLIEEIRKGPGIDSKRETW
jgi:uncharacterized protein (DUF1684 family)